jgi:branched-chain amino acid transport system substrate-binding protein
MPVFEGAGILTISPTITGMDFHGKDDYLVRINRTTRDNARDYAKVLFARGQKRIGVALDLGNRVFTESWLKEFRAALEALGGAVIVEVPYESGDSADFGTVMRGLLNKQPEGLLFLSGAIDVARLAQQARKQAPQLPISASEWAGTEQLLDLGGTVVEELLIVQNFNPDDRSSRYVAFREAYFRRFKRDPGYSSVMAYDAATVLLEALRRRSSGETLKQAIPQYGPYEGLQQQIAFDANGDTERKVFFTEIRKGKFQLLE